MIALISPAKKIAFAPEPAPPTSTQPVMLEQAEILVEAARELSADDLQRLMKISPALAELNQGRFQSFEVPFDAENARPAALTFAGDTYVGLDAGTLSAADLDFAQSRLGILSGLYGLLRPLDLIQPYRLEMGTRMKNPRGANLYAFWGERIAREINARTEAHADRTIVNLASNEYFKSVPVKALVGPVITPIFKERRDDGSLKVISFLAKRARGSMARFMIQERLEAPAGLKGFTADGYAYQAALSSETDWVFTRG